MIHCRKFVIGPLKGEHQDIQLQLKSIHLIFGKGSSLSENKQVQKDQSDIDFANVEKSGQRIRLRDVLLLNLRPPIQRELVPNCSTHQVGQRTTISG